MKKEYYLKWVDDEGVLAWHALPGDGLLRRQILKDLVQMGMAGRISTQLLKAATAALIDEEQEARMRREYLCKQPACECGGEKTKTPHSRWCPKYEEN